MASISAQLVYVGSIASTGTASAIIPIPRGAGLQTGIQSVELTLASVYAAVAGTSGVTFSYQFSSDGVTYSAANVGNTVVKNGAGVRTDGTAMIAIDNVLKVFTGGPINFIKVNISNADTANASVTAVLARFHNGLV
jgi:hypothetical protein